MKKLLPLILGLLGLGAGVGAGFALQPAGTPEEAALANPCGDVPAADHSSEAPKPAPEGEVPFDYIKLDNQFIVPLVRDSKVAALVVVTLSLEIEPGTGDEVFMRQPKLEDALLAVLFDHANAGGFDGSFTASGNMTALRGGLREVARSTVGTVVNDVLITGIVRQEV